jgi:hypothetical protein
MHIDLYQTLKAIKVSDDQAAKAVASLEEFMAVKISEANKGLESRFSALESELKSTKWLLGYIGVILTVIGLVPVLTKLF